MWQICECWSNDVDNNTRQKTMVNKTDYKEVTVCRNDLYTVGLEDRI